MIAERGSRAEGHKRMRMQRARVRNTVIGQSKFSIGAGRSKVVRVKLSHKGRSLVNKARKHGLRAKAAGAGVRPRTVILKPVRPSPREQRRGTPVS